MQRYSKTDAVVSNQAKKDAPKCTLKLGDGESNSTTKQLLSSSHIFCHSCNKILWAFIICFMSIGNTVNTASFNELEMAEAELDYC